MHHGTVQALLRKGVLREAGDGLFPGCSQTIHLEGKGMSNPFITGHYNGHPVGATDAQSRLDMVKAFDLDQCRAALQVAGLQKTVRTAVERRIRKLERS